MCSGVQMLHKSKLNTNCSTSDGRNFRKEIHLIHLINCVQPYSFHVSC